MVVEATAEEFILEVSLLGDLCKRFSV